MQLTTAETFHERPPDPNIPVPAWTLVWHSERFQREGRLPSDKVTSKPQIIVKVSAGRWCAECPWCPASEYPAITDRRFICSQCHNNGSYSWLTTFWPDDDALEMIDTILMLRPIPGTRNWVPPESTLLLAMENEIMGIPTLGVLNMALPAGKELEDVRLRLLNNPNMALAPPELRKLLMAPDSTPGKRG